MKDATASLAKKPSQKPDQARKLSDEGISLARCYGKIGISAVAAAARYQGAAKNPAYAPAPTKWHDRTDYTGEGA